MNINNKQTENKAHFWSGPFMEEDGYFITPDGQKVNYASRDIHGYNDCPIISELTYVGYFDYKDLVRVAGYLEESEYF